MSGGKKFNIWIAYSDLFSNLSVFLFIAAFGVLAALGASNAPRIDKGVYVCSDNPKPITDALQGAGHDGTASVFLQATFRNEREQRCRRHYTMKDYHFLPKRNDIAAFVRPWRRPAAIEGICEQLWAAATRNDLAANDGKITLVGTIGMDSGARCIAERKDEPSVRIEQWNARMHEVDCWLKITDPVHHHHFVKGCSKFRKANSFCFPVRSYDPDTPCSHTKNQIDRDTLRRMTCLEGAATERAESLFRYCRSAVLRDDYRTDLIWAPGGTARQPRDYSDLDEIWRKRVGYRGEATSEPIDDSSQANNSIYVELQYALKLVRK